jgi:hypothetical protein
MGRIDSPEKEEIKMSSDIWIIGVGRFGLRAARKLSQKRKNTHLRLVDPLEANLLQAAEANHTLVNADGVAYLTDHLKPHHGPDWIIPALPLHLAAEWCLARLHDQGVRRIALPHELHPLLPNPIAGADEDIYVSHANFTCPANCPEPSDMCTVTQKPRPKNMFDLLAAIKLSGFQAIVIRSHQIGPGIGGYQPKQLFAMLNQVSKIRGPVMLATACRCHGVITGLQRI